MDSLHLIRLPCNKKILYLPQFFSSSSPILFLAVVSLLFLIAKTITFICRSSSWCFCTLTFFFIIFKSLLIFLVLLSWLFKAHFFCSLLRAVLFLLFSGCKPSLLLCRVCFCFHSFIVSSSSAGFPLRGSCVLQVAEQALQSGWAFHLRAPVVP